MNTTEPNNTRNDSLDYCVDFWKDALDPEDAIDHFVRELPRHVRTAGDAA